MLISIAHAQEAADAAASVAGPDLITTFLPIILIFVVFYFLLIRPQQKQIKQHKEMVQALSRGDRVVTAGGIVGTISKVNDAEDELLVEIAEGVKVRVVRGTVSQVLQKTSAAGNDNGGKDDKKDKVALGK